jgi:3-phenylpropionate/trans-cinnamate dioxygenase ferredoxin reductase subunit
MERIVIVGASLAGTTAAQTLRRQGFGGSVTLIGDEIHYPYDRPPLSKDFLAGATGEDRLRLRAAADPDELGVEWVLGRRAVSLDHDPTTGAGQVRVRGSGEADTVEQIPFDGLIVATGARARTLPGTDLLHRVQVLRTLDDALALRQLLASGPGRVVVIGAGFIGAEVASTARQQGLDVTIVDAADTPMSRVLDPASGMAIADLHRGHGVDVRLGVGVGELVSTDPGSADGSALSAVVLSDGSTIEAGVVVVGVGVVPNTEWLAGSGLTIDDGVVADETGLAAPGVTVAGDVARWPNARFDGRLMRVEQWDNAGEMGAHAAKRLLAWADGGSFEPFQPVPWFWSDQYDRKIQLAGVVSDRAELVQGTVEEQRFVQVYLDHRDRAVGALCWNRPRQAIMARSLMADGLTRAEAADELG